VQLFEPDDVIADVFAGVGPFAIPAAKKGCAVLANDLNPISVKYLSQNVRDNRVSLKPEVCPIPTHIKQVMDLVRVFCQDGGHFIRSVTGRVLENPLPPYSGPRQSRMQEKKLQKLKQIVSPGGTSELSPAPKRLRISHFVMNLPDSAIQFLDAFRGIYSAVNNGGQDLSGIYEQMPMIHCHCFTRELDPIKAELDIKKVCWCISHLVGID